MISEIKLVTLRTIKGLIQAVLLQDSYRNRSNLLWQTNFECLQ